MIRWFLAGMVADKHRVSASKAKELGMLDPVTGVSALSKVLTGLSVGTAVEAVSGAAGAVYWQKLLANVRPTPHIFKQVARTRLNTSNLFAMIGMAGVFGILKIRRSKGPARRPVQSIIKPPSLPFLPRDQTDEWKGWMQLLILIYHYNAAFWYDEFWQIIRICIASYLFQTGFGHTVYFLTKRDFSLSRVVNVMVRTNILPCTLAYIMRTNWLLYYYM